MSEQIFPPALVKLLRGRPRHGIRILKKVFADYEVVPPMEDWTNEQNQRVAYKISRLSVSNSDHDEDEDEVGGVTEERKSGQKRGRAAADELEGEQPSPSAKRRRGDETDTRDKSPSTSTSPSDHDRTSSPARSTTPSPAPESARPPAGEQGPAPTTMEVLGTSLQIYDVAETTEQLAAANEVVAGLRLQVAAAKEAARETQDALARKTGQLLQTEIHADVLAKQLEMAKLAEELKRCRERERQIEHGLVARHEQLAAAGGTAPSTRPATAATNHDGEQV